jgi:uncharacterized membrane protein
MNFQPSSLTLPLRHFLNFNRRLIACALASTSLVASTFAQPRYAVTDLGVLPGCDTSVAVGLNDRGDIAGYCQNRGDQVAVIWRNGQLINLGKLTGGTFAAATSINSQGTVVGDGDTGDGRPRIWVSTANGLYNFFSNNGGNTHATSIGDTGFIGGYYTKSLSGNTSGWRGSIWTPDPRDPRKYRQTDLPVIPGINSKFTSAISWAFNQSGQAAGWAANDLIGQHACFWNNDSTHSIVDLGTYPGDWSSLAWGMNDLGQVAGESHPPFANRAIVWNNDPAHTPTELPLLAGDNMGSASRINNLGHTLGWSAFSPDGSFNNMGPEKLVLWREGAVFDLQSILDSVSGAGWMISTASAINNLGQIVGLGVHNGQNRAYLLTPLN